MNKDFWERIDRLEELAGKATESVVKINEGDQNTPLQSLLFVAQYNAAANPAMILKMIAEMRRLEKEADWLASMCSSLSLNTEGCEDCCLNGECPHNDIHTETMCTEPQDWREAARKVISETDNA